MRSKAIKLAVLAVAGALALPGLAKAADVNYGATGLILIPGLASFDISWVDFAQGGYYLADRTNKAIDFKDITTVTTGNNALDFSFTANFVGVAAVGGNDFSGPNGVQTIQGGITGNTESGDREIWAGDGPQLNQGCPSFLGGKCSTTKVIDATTGELTHVIPTGGAARADELCLDTDDNLVLIANDAEADLSFGTPFITFISTKGTNAYKIVAQLQIPQTTGGIEQCQYDHDTHLFFLNIPQVNGAQGQVLVIPPPTGNPVKVLGSYVIPLAQCALPQGMAIGGPGTGATPGGPWLMLGCNGVATGGFRNSVIISKLTGANVAIAWGLGGADETWSNDTNFQVTGSSCTATTCLNGNTSQFGVVNFQPNNAQVVSINGLGLVLGGVSSHSIAADCFVGSTAHSGDLFLPVAGGVQIFTSSVAPPTGSPTRSCPTQ